jgi:hypothetical protein
MTQTEKFVAGTIQCAQTRTAGVDECLVDIE